jgi:murein DD-endopeptidase MepM/ murein hydrolase activator NlpD
MFAPIGTFVYSPIDGVVLDSRDDWKGYWERKKGLVYEGGGFGMLSGNGVLLFQPSDTTYFFIIHMKDVFVKPGDLVYKGRVVGSVGKTGNASSPYTKPHIHISVKKTGVGCGVDGVLVSENPYSNLKYARENMLKKEERIYVDGF